MNGNFFRIDWEIKKILRKVSKAQEIQDIKSSQYEPAAGKHVNQMQ